MVEVRPFKGYHYDFEGLRKSPEELVAPPYDVVSEKMRESLASEPLNICNVMLGDRSDSYAGASKMLESWISSGKIVRDDSQCYYAYEQTFSIEGKVYQRNGFMALVRIEPLGKSILPHEKTHPKAKEDRLELLRAIKANIEQIFMIYDDKDDSIGALLSRIKQPANEVLSFKDFDDVRHRVFRIPRQSDQSEISACLYGKKVLIADGHHRYEVARSYAAETDNRSGAGPHDFVLCTLVNARDPGLIMLPTHRLVHSLSEEQVNSLKSRISAKFDIEPVGDKASLLTRLEGREGCGAIGVWLIKKGSGFIASLKPEFCSKDPVEKLDVSILHKYIVEEALGITKEMQDRKEKIEFVKGTEESFELAERDDFQILFLLTPSSIPEVMEAAESGKLLPHKSTYFYPKVWSGLVMYMHRE
jgi:uncharacterized protein (DUF1015 family)